MTGLAYNALGKAVAKFIRDAGLPIKLNVDGEMLTALYYIKAVLINTDLCDSDKITWIKNIFDQYDIHFDDIG